MESDSDDDNIDILSSLIPSTSKHRPTKPSTSSSNKGKAPIPTNNHHVDADSDDDDDGEDAIFSSLSALTRSRNLSEGKDAIKSLPSSKKSSRTLTGGGSFQALGLPASLLKALLLRGFSTPTPIQRLALPSILGSTEQIVAGKKLTIARDHLCMARTGSGKTLCYLLPLLAQLMVHSKSYGARGLVLVPTRELALQVLKVGKDLARGLKAGDGEGESLRWAMVVGGEGMEEQFEMMAGNPDVIIATPGRLLHLIVEMSLDLRAVQYCVFDEADRLFELGFNEQLHEILHRLPPTRQTLLFSATLPSSLVGFAKAGLQNPKLIRLDVESKISTDLRMAYLSVKESEKEALLLGLLREVVGCPLMSDEQRRVKDEYIEDEADDEERGRKAWKGAKGKGKKRKRGDPAPAGDDDDIDPTLHQTLVFVSTKHHVEYITSLLTHSGYAVSPIYGSMDQTARRLSLARFRSGRTNILVVTDLAARGIDVPGVENVINYDFPNGTRAFVHRVGRTARAGRKGWAHTLVTAKELPHLLDLELFLGRSVKTCPLEGGDEANTVENVDFQTQLVLGTAPRSLLDLDLESFRSLCSREESVGLLGDVARRGQRMYEKGLQHASPESYRRAKELQRKGHGLASNSGESSTTHPIYSPYLAITGIDKNTESERSRLLDLVNGFKPRETVFEVGAKGVGNELGALMRSRRVAMGKSERARRMAEEIEEGEDKLPELDEEEEAEEKEREKKRKRVVVEEDEADREEVEAVFGKPRERKKATGKGASYRDPQFYLDYEQEGADTERGYALTAGDSFVAQASQSQYDVAGRGDTEGIPADALLQRASTLRWDRRTKKFVKGDGVGADNKKMIKSESGQKLSATFKSGVFDEWKRKQHIKVPKVGEEELKGRTNTAGRGGAGDKKYRHRSGEKSDMGSGEKRKGRSVGKPNRPGTPGGGLKSAETIRKDRVAKAKRVHRSTGPGKKGKGASSGGSGGGGGKGRR